MDKRVKFDLEINFTNGGHIKGKGFRLDIAGDNIPGKELADYIVEDLGLLIGHTKILNKEILNEKHKRENIARKVVHEVLIDLSHTIENGKDLSEIGLESFADLDGIVIHIPYSETVEITEEYLKNHETSNRAVLDHSGWDQLWDTENYYENHPYLTKGAADYLRDCCVKLAGIDSHNIDNTKGKSRPVHATLLGAEFLIVEHLCNLHLLPQVGFTFRAIPPKFKRAGTFPVGAMAKIIKTK